MGTAKWRLALCIGVTIWRFEQERENEKGEAISTTRTLLGRPEPAGLAGGRSQRILFTTLGFPAGVFPTFWELVFSGQLLSGVEKACRYMDRTGYQWTTRGLCSKMTPTAIWRLFCTQAYCRCDWLGPVFPRVGSTPSALGISSLKAR